LGKHCGCGLLENLVSHKLCGFKGNVCVFDLAFCGEVVFADLLEVAYGVRETALHGTNGA
jgi:hypothetical protein